MQQTTVIEGYEEVMLCEECGLINATECKHESVWSGYVKWS